MCQIDGNRLQNPAYSPVIFFGVFMRTSVRTNKRNNKSGRNLVIPTGAIILIVALIALFKGAEGLNRNLSTKIDSVDISLIWESGDLTESLN